MYLLSNQQFPVKFEKCDIFNIFQNFIFYLKIIRSHLQASGMASKLYEWFRRKPGWRFTACFEYQNHGSAGQNGAAHADARDHENVDLSCN